MPGGLQGFPGDVNIQGSLFVQGAVTVGAGGSLAPTFPVLAPNGSANAPPYSFASESTAGVYRNGVNQIGFSISGAGVFGLNSTQILFSSTSSIGWEPGALYGAPGDVFLARNAAGVLEIDNGTPGTFRDLALRSLLGVTSNTAALAGAVGEVITATAAPAAVALTTGVSVNVTSIALTAGDWDVAGAINFTFGATTSVTNLSGGASQVTGTLPTQDSRFDVENAAQVPTAGAVGTYPIPVTQQLVAGPTTVFLVTQASFTVSTLSAGGTLRARRMR